MKSLVMVAGLVVGAGRIASAGPICVPDGATTDSIVLAGTALSFCFEGSFTPRRCVGVEITTGVMNLASSVASSSPRPTAETTEHDVTVCQVGNTGCRTFTPKFRINNGTGFRAAVSDDGKLAAAYSRNSVETYDVQTGKTLAAFKSGADAESCTYVGFAGDVVVVNNFDCSVGRGTGWLATAKGKRIASVGGGKGALSTSAHVGGKQWAFVSDRGDKLWLQDVKTGKVANEFALAAAGLYDSAEVRVGSGYVVVLFGGGRGSGSISVVTLATGKVANYRATMCADTK